MRIFLCKWVASSVVAALSTITLSATASSMQPSINELKSLSLVDLLNTQTILADSRGKGTTGDAAASVTVITAQDIRRSGATSIPEMLRMVPGLEIARLNQHAWSVTSRGFAGLQNDKLLVLVDGRSVYSRTTSNVGWFSHADMLLNDIERIEIVRGPGGALWGSNAVNGVINIITKSSQDTQGAAVSLGAGNTERAMDLRYGGKEGNLYYRIFAKGVQRTDSVDEDGNSFKDPWNMQRGGFRLDGTLSRRDSYMLQGELINHGNDVFYYVPTFTPPDYQDGLYKGTIHDHGGHLLGRFKRHLGKGSEWYVQTFYDRIHRSLPTYEYFEETLDLEFQHNLTVKDKHKLVWGLGYRLMRDEFSIKNFDIVTFDPKQRTTHLLNAFVQDEIKLRDNWALILGSKFEHNSYSGFEVQPSLRVRWKPQQNQTAWAAISRAVRTPNRLDHNVLFDAGVLSPEEAEAPLPVALKAIGRESFDSESILAYEIGFRSQPSWDFRWDFSAFFNQYDDLYMIGLGEQSLYLSDGYVLQNLYPENGMDGEGIGAELAAHWRMSEEWNLELAYTWLKLDLHTKPGFVAALERDAEGQEGKVPEHQLSARLSYDLNRYWLFDFWLRYVDDLPTLKQDAYVNLDARVAWRPTGKDNFEISLSGWNLLESNHTEFGQTAELGGDNLSALERAFYLKFYWSVY